MGWGFIDTILSWMRSEYLVSPSVVKREGEGRGLNQMTKSPLYPELWRHGWRFMINTRASSSSPKRTSFPFKKACRQWKVPNVKKS